VGFCCFGELILKGQSQDSFRRKTLVQESREQEGCLEPVKLVEASPEGFCLLKTVIAVAFMEPLQVSASYPNMLLQQFSFDGIACFMYTYFMYYSFSKISTSSEAVSAGQHVSAPAGTLSLSLLLGLLLLRG
jgi:hypothetical protein